jgi:predicted nucleic acid-binding protein
MRQWNTDVSALSFDSGGDRFPLSIDAPMAAIARANDLVLLASDTCYFPQVQGLAIEDWLTMEGNKT